MYKKPELLLPAKDLETLKLAIHYGADAVYIGGKAFGLRAGATNFTPEQMKEAIEFAHERGRKIYITANIIARNEDIKKAHSFFEGLKDLGPDGVLVADPGMMMVLKEAWPDAPVHISTQAGNSNYATFRFWYEQGIKRVVCERLLTLEEISEIKENIPPDMEVEAFVHGAMCISFSGRCLLSAALTGRDANKGECTHPCRWQYSLVESQRPGEYFSIDEDEGGTYIMNSKDLCMIDKIPELLGAGIDSLKIEGRMKSPLYVATVARSYRRAIDECMEDEASYREHIPGYIAAVSETTHRPYGHGFYYGDEGRDATTHGSSDYVTEYVYLGYVEEVRDDGSFLIHQKNKFSVGDTIEVMSPKGDNISTRVISISDMDGNACESCPHPGQALYIKLEYTPKELDLLRSIGKV